MKCSVWASLVLLLAGGNLHAAIITTTVYSNFTDTGSNITFSGSVLGTIGSSNVQFGASQGNFNWHPFGAGAFATDTTGWISVASNGTYTFNMPSDDGSYLFIDGSLVLNNGGDHAQPGGNPTANISLTAGVHTFEVKFQENGVGPSGVDLNLPTGVTFVGNPVPEPSTFAIFGLMLAMGAGCYFYRRRAFAPVV